MKNKIIGSVLISIPFLIVYLLVGFSEGFLPALKIIGVFVLLGVSLGAIAASLIGGLFLLLK